MIRALAQTTQVGDWVFIPKTGYVGRVQNAMYGTDPQFDVEFYDNQTKNLIVELKHFREVERVANISSHATMGAFYQSMYTPVALYQQEDHKGNVAGRNFGAEWPLIAEAKVCGKHKPIVELKIGERSRVLHKSGMYYYIRRMT